MTGNFTQLADDRLDLIKEYKENQEIISKADNPEKLTILIKNTIGSSKKFSDVIKRVIVDKKIGQEFFQNTSLEELDDKNIKILIEKVFEKNGMKNRGSLFGKTGLKSYILKDANFEKPAWTIGRDKAFLFGFGLGLNALDVETMLMVDFNQSGFNKKDYMEVIFYFCLKNGYNYQEMLDLKRRCEEFSNDKKTKLEEKRTEFYIIEADKIYNESALIQHAGQLYVDNINEHSKTKTKYFKQFLKYLFEDSSLEENLRIVKEMDRIEDKRKDLKDNEDKNKSKSRRKTYKKNIETFEKSIDRLQYDDFEKNMPKTYDHNVIISNEIIQLSSILKCVKWTGDSLKKKIYERCTEISREDIILSVFLYEAYMFETDEEFVDATFDEKEGEFMYTVNNVLTNCYMSDYYYGNPLEMFLILCLYNQKPYSFFMKTWEESKKED